MTAIYYDCEFLEDGSTIDLISIGMVAENGDEYYAVSREFDQGAVKRHPWLSMHVWLQLPLDDSGPELGGPWLADHPDVKPRAQIANEVRQFINSVPDPQLWAWYGAYDHVALAQLFGRMIDLPTGIPMWTNDLRQECERLGNPRLPEQSAGEHNALEDARHNREMARALAEYAKKARA